MADPIYLRPEARPVEWYKLDDAQLKAFNHMLKSIVAATRRIDESMLRREAQPGDPTGWLSRDRTNQLLFLDGARGTGKTTVLTTLINASVGQPRAASTIGRPSGAPSSPDPNDLQILRTRVVWLEPLDMEPAPPSMNILPAILARIDAATYRQGVGSRAGGTERAFEYQGLLEPDADLQEALIEFQRFQANTALGWDSNLGARAGSLDPDSYVVEVLRAERSRLRVNRTLEDLLDKLASTAFRGSMVWDPLFVLPVDDFDLNPSASLILLYLLRMISVRRLFIIILGDLSVAEIIANLKVSSDLATVAETAARISLLSIPRETVTAMGADLAANVLRKLIPPGQRIKLRPFYTLEALNARPFGAVDTAPQGNRMTSIYSAVEAGCALARAG